VLLIETVTVAVAPAARVPLVGEERLTQACVLEAVQFTELPPGLLTV
jgi:hypothetical protein